MKIHYFQHVSFEDPAALFPWFQKQGGHRQTVTHWYDPACQPPAITDVDLLIILGGPMNVSDESLHAWLADEKRYLRDYLEHARPALGICLGAQLLSETLGGSVQKGQAREIGWHMVTKTDSEERRFFKYLPGRFIAFNWHGDYFTIPPGSRRLAQSTACANQAFAARNNILGLQSHLESTKESIDRLIENCSEDIRFPGDSIDSREALLEGRKHLADQSVLLDSLMRGFLETLLHA